MEAFLPSVFSSLPRTLLPSLLAWLITACLAFKSPPPHPREALELKGGLKLRFP